MAYVLVGLALVTVIFGGNNAGGEAAHLGGAAAGMVFHSATLTISMVFSISSEKQIQHRNILHARERESTQEDVDRILDKIHDKGLQSLSSKEKKILHDASTKRREDS